MKTDFAKSKHKTVARQMSFLNLSTLHTTETLMHLRN